MAKILYFDIETSFNIGAFWRPGMKVSLTTDQIIEERRIICVCYKWAGEKKVHTLDWGLNKQCDKKIIEKIAPVLAQADLVVGHNSDRFDIRWLNGRCLYHGLKPLPAIRTEDTYKMAKRKFDLNGYRLDYLGEYLNVGRKIQTGGLGLWKRIHFDKCKKSLNDMIKYCIQDVKLLEEVHNKIAPHCERKVRIFDNSLVGCQNCGETKPKKDTQYTTAGGTTYVYYHCQDCGTRAKITKKKWLEAQDL